MSGRELPERLRMERPEPNVILVSGYGRELEGVDVEPFRGDDIWFLQKPCPARVLATTVRACLGGKSRS